MPVTALYCEGNAQSIDIRVIRQLAPKCDIKPLGGKTSTFMGSVIADRRRNPNLACLVDRDFDCSFGDILEQPIPYKHRGTWIGWTWERKEIENYLIDPVVVKSALGNNAPPMDEYQAALEKAAETIATYSAARTALACEQFKNFWGDEVRDGYFFPRKTGKKECLEKINQLVESYKQFRIVSGEDVVDKFNWLLPDCRPGGNRFSNFLYFFAGKDLLYALRQDLERLGFEPSAGSTSAPEKVFIERIVDRIERLPNVWEWLPEWTALRQSLEEADFSKV